ncbi:MAG: Holliday junction resolvase-like protein [Ignavibacteriaceae bacterium]|nr:Holliday junction resolvase-like protein [Ignavibacteriaceae bacterium]
MKNDILKYFKIQRQIFGICPHSEQFFRLSECKLFFKDRPKNDWMDEINDQSNKLDLLEDKISELEEKLREIARAKGRILANKLVRKIDPLFIPRKLNPDDAKVIFHPVDFVVFNGMKTGPSIKNILFLDRECKNKDQKGLQKSIEKVVEKENYEWITLRVQEDGVIREE